MIPETCLPKTSRLKFGLAHLFYATALVASGLALSRHTIMFSVFLLIAWGIVFGFQSVWNTLFSRVRIDTFVSILFFLALFVWLSLIAIAYRPYQVSRETPRISMSLNNLRQTMIASHNFESAFRRFPTDQIVTNSDGTQLRHSWRISILPFIEETALYESYDFNEPWNGPNNSKLADKMPEVWRCPFNRKTNSPLTPYKLVNGPGTAFEIGKAASCTSVPDGMSMTIALIEDTENPVHWMEPTDLTAKEAAEILNANNMLNGHVVEGLFQRQYLGSNLALLDGSSHCLPGQFAAPIDKGEFLIADGVLFNQRTKKGSLVEIKYHAFFALGLYLALVLLPVVFLWKSESRRAMP